MLSRCGLDTRPGRFRCDSGHKQPGPARLGLHPSLRSKLPCVSILRASYCHAAGWAHGRVDNSSDSGQTRFSPWLPLGSAHPLRSLSPLCACPPRFLVTLRRLCNARLPYDSGWSWAAELLAQPDVDGGLIGGASLKPADFVQIINSANQE